MLCLLVLPALCGCGTAGTVEFERPIRRASPILVSEIAGITDWTETGDAAFVLRNTTDEVARVRYDGAGCSCYRVQCNATPLQRGEEIPLPPGGEVVVAFDLQPPTRSGESEYRAQFTWVDAESERPLPISLVVEVLDDCRVIPDTIALAVRREAPAEPVPLRLQRTTRGSAAVTEPPDGLALPNDLTATAWTPLPPVQLAADLWRSEWESQVSLVSDAGRTGTRRWNVTCGWLAGMARPPHC